MRNGSVYERPTSERFTSAIASGLLPTPTSRDHKGGYSTRALVRKDGKSRALDLLPNAAIGGIGVELVDGTLSPLWVEWLMGYPIGHTDCEDWGIQWSHRYQLGWGN